MSKYSWSGTGHWSDIKYKKPFRYDLKPNTGKREAISSIWFLLAVTVIFLLTNAG